MADQLSPEAQRDQVAEILREAVALYGKPGGPWNVPSDPGGWLERARAALELVPMPSQTQPRLLGPCAQIAEIDICCWSCARARGLLVSHMILCPTCRNKRCPKASDHSLACTGSNEPGQPGSIYA